MSAANNRAAEAAVPDSKTAAAPRKRRRRAPTTGATEDCFTCRKRGTKCDRKRPYCNQCIELGKECSGYRTTLTWGVGVASRGKLRGMTLPIARSLQTPAQLAQQAQHQKQNKTPSTPTSKPPARKQSSTPFTLETPLTKLETVHSPLSSPAASIHSFDDYGFSHTAPIPIPPPVSTPPTLSWHTPGFGEHVDRYHTMHGKPRSFLPPGPLHRLQTTMATSFDDTLSTSTGPLSTYSDSDYPSPGEFPATPEEYTFVEAPMPHHQFASPYMNGGAPVNSSESLSFAEPPRSYPVHHDDLSSSIGSDRSAPFMEHAAAMNSHSVPVTTSIQDMYFGHELATSGPSDFPYGIAFERRTTEPMIGHSMASGMGPMSATIPRSYLPSACGF